MNSNEGKISFGTIVWTVLFSVALIVAALLIGHRYAVCPGVLKGQVYQMDRLTGSISTLMPRSDLGPPASAKLSDHQHKDRLRRDIIDLTRQASSFYATCKPVLMAAKHNTVIEGWSVYAVKGDSLLPWNLVNEDDISRGKYVVSYTYRAYRNRVSYDTLGWHWEVFFKERIVRQVSGNPLLEHKYGLKSPPAGSSASIRMATKEEDRKATQKYIASRRGKAYHLPDCRWVIDLPADSLLHFKTIQEAEAAGLRPCRTCKPHLKH